MRSCLSCMMKRIQDWRVQAPPPVLISGMVRLSLSRFKQLQKGNFRGRKPNNYANSRSFFRSAENFISIMNRGDVELWVS
jgi:hypothetical protein